MDLEALRTPVARALDLERVEVLEAREESLAYDAFMAGRSVSRLSGVARAGGELRPWSMIRKVTDGPATAPAYLYANGRRELRAYASGMLDALPTGFAAPAAYGLQEGPDGRLELLLEEVADDEPGMWSPDRFVDAARHLGRHAGAGVDSVAAATQPWLFHGWRERHGQPERIPEALRTVRRLGLEPVAMARLGPRIAGRAAQLLADQARLRAVLGALPQTLCHHDAQRSNLYARTRNGAPETVAIDWETPGPGALGADLCSLLFSSVRRGDLSVDALRELRADALDAHGEGLMEAGWHGDEELLRLGFCSAIALRWSLVYDVLVALTKPGARVVRGRALDEPPEDALDALVALTGVLLEAGDEARATAVRLDR